MAKVHFPAHEKANVTRPCLVAACRGNENIADLLNYLIYEAEKMKVEEDEITLQLSHEKILKRKDGTNRFNFSERSLITYLRLLDEWQMVGCGKYGRSQIVRPGKINSTISSPPEKPRRIKTGGRKRCKDESYLTASTLEEMLQISNAKVEKLQEKVESLQLKVEKLQHFVEKFQLSQSANGSLEAALNGKNPSLDIVDIVDNSRRRYEGRNAPAKAEIKPTELFPAKVSRLSQLTEAEAQLWEYWCNLWFNKNMPPNLDEFSEKAFQTAYAHIKKLAPLVKSQEDMNQLEDFTRKEQEERGIKRKTLFLGNLVSSYRNWTQAQPREQPTAPAPTAERPAEDPDRLVLWYKNDGQTPAIVNKAKWNLYAEIPLALALARGYETRFDPVPADRNTILHKLRLAAEQVA